MISCLLVTWSWKDLSDSHLCAGCPAWGAVGCATLHLCGWKCRHREEQGRITRVLPFSLGGIFSGGHCFQCCLGVPSVKPTITLILRVWNLLLPFDQLVPFPFILDERGWTAIHRHTQYDHAETRLSTQDKEHPATFRPAPASAHLASYLNGDSTQAKGATWLAGFGGHVPPLSKLPSYHFWVIINPPSHILKKTSTNIFPHLLLQRYRSFHLAKAKLERKEAETLPFWGSLLCTRIGELCDFLRQDEML